MMRFIDNLLESIGAIAHYQPYLFALAIAIWLVFCVFMLAFTLEALCT